MAVWSSSSIVLLLIVPMFIAAFAAGYNKPCYLTKYMVVAIAMLAYLTASTFSGAYSVANTRLDVMGMVSPCEMKSFNWQVSYCPRQYLKN